MVTKKMQRPPRRLKRPRAPGRASQLARLPEARRVAAIGELLYAVDQRDGYIEALRDKIRELLAFLRSAARMQEAVVEIAWDLPARPKGTRVSE